MIPQNKRLIYIVAAIGMLLLVPLVAMQFTAEVQWTLFDFIAAGVLLLIAGLILEWMLRTVPTIKQRILMGMVLFLVFFLLWAELAVGVFGTPFAGH